MKTQKEISLPAICKWIIKLFIPEYECEYFVNDLEEAYGSIKNEKGKAAASLWLCAQIAFSIPPIITDNIQWSLEMFKNYFKVLLRNISRNKAYSFINIFGLAVGLASCLLIFLFINYELSFDKFHEKCTDAYVVGITSDLPEGIEYSTGTQFPFTKAMRNDFTDVEQVTQIYFQEELSVVIGNEIFLENNVMFTEPQFLNILDYDIKVGGPAEVLNEPNAVIITEEFASKHFGGRSPVGEIIKLDDRLEVEVRGVIENPPDNTNYPFSMLVSVESLTPEYVGLDMESWGMKTTSNSTLVLLPKGMNPDFVAKQFKEFSNKYIPTDDREIDSYCLVPLYNVHYDSRFQLYTYQVSRQTLGVFAAIGLLILIIASINFINLTTAQSVKRSKEVGIRKVLGAHRAQLVRQYMSESMNFTLIAIVLSVIIAWLFLPYLSQFLGNNTELHLFGNIFVPLFLLVMFAVVSLLTGIYPAIVLSNYSPANAFRNKYSTKKPGLFSLRNSLVIVQFIISQILIVATIVIASQLDMIQNRELGFTKESIVATTIPNPDLSTMDVIENRLMSNSNIKEVSFALAPPTSQMIFNANARYNVSGREADEIIQIKVTDENYLNTFDIELLAGRYLNKYKEGDSVFTYVINETLMHKMGITNPQEAVGNTMEMYIYSGEIIGVVKDFNMSTLHSEIPPVAFVNFVPRFIRSMSVKIAPDNVPQTLSLIEDVWKDAYPNHVYQMEFYDEYIGQLYEEEARVFSIINFFAIIAIIIGCLGLLGLISFIVVQKTKEIGIRKVLGASEASILIILAKDFLKSFIISNIIAWPLAYYVMNKWLDNYAFRIEISLMTFIVAGGIGLLIAALTIIFKAVKAARVNPVVSLKYE